MSTALAIAGVTAVLRDRLNDGMVNHNVAGLLGSTVNVSVLPPDRVVPANGTEASQLNLFLYAVTPNIGMRNEALPSRDASGRHRLTNAPLAIDLHYLISAYSGGDYHAEILLGYAMQLMHEYPVITREMIRRTFPKPPSAPDPHDVGDQLPPALRALADSGLADQLELLKITPQILNSEEVSKLWTATQSSYRPTAAYQISVVLIEARTPTRPTLPVLTRGGIDGTLQRERGPMVNANLLAPLPTIEAVLPANKQPAARLGQTITLQGHHLNGLNPRVRLVNARFAVDELLPAADPDPAKHDALSFVIPPARAGDFPVGVYELSVLIRRPGETQARESNRLACVIAPDITNLPQSIVRDGNGDAALTISFTPDLAAEQIASLLIGQREVAASGSSGPGSLDFVIEDAEPGEHLARLRIDGIESAIVDRAAEPPVFLDQRVSIS